MNLQARRKTGGKYSAEDVLEVVFNNDNVAMYNVVHTVNVVSGVEVTHGGGAPSGEHLHYKSHQTDANADGIIDYSSVDMRLEQVEKGVSTITVSILYTEKAPVDEWEAQMAEIKAREEAEGVSIETPPFPEPKSLTTGEITLEWTDDTFV